MGRTLTGPGNVARSGDTMLGAFNEAKGNDIASATNINLVIATGNLVDITGGNTIISMTLAPGAERTLRFTSTLRLTNSSTLVLPVEGDILTLPGDFATVRGYPGGVVRCVAYTRATGYVQKIGDTLKGTLILTAGTGVTPPLKYQAGALTNLTVPHASEWNGSNLFMTNASGTRRQVMYINDDASQLTGLTQTQVINGLGYTPFNPGLSSGTLVTPGGLLEVGRYFDFHSANGSNDFDARIDVGTPPGGSGSSNVNFMAGSVSLNGNVFWTQASLTNLNQLTNGPGYAPLASPSFTGVVNITGKANIYSGSPAAPGLTFNVSGDNTGIYGISAGRFAFTANGFQVIEINHFGMKFLSGEYAPNGAFFTLQRSYSSLLSGDPFVGTQDNRVIICEDGGTRRGAYIDLSTCSAASSSRILTSEDIGLSSISQNGYQRLPGGLIMQWGRKYNAGLTTQYMAFPMTFPTACLSFYTSYDSTGTRGDYGSGGSVTQSGAQIHTDGTDVWWLALGY